MPDKEATARIKINKLLEAAGWRFFAGEHGPANIERKIQAAIARVWGEGYETRDMRHEAAGPREAVQAVLDL